MIHLLSQGDPSFAERFLSLGAGRRRMIDGLLLERAPLIQPRSEFFIASRQGRPKARLGAAVTASGEAYLGFLEVEGGEGAGELFAAAKEWLRFSGAKRVFAPVDLSTWFTYRLRLPDSRGSEPSFSWEPDFSKNSVAWERAGFATTERYTSRGWRSDDPALLLEIGRSGERCLKRLERHQFRFEWPKELTPAILKRVHALTLSSFPGVPHFEPIDFDLFSQIYVLGTQERDEVRLVFCIAPDGADAGFIYCFRERGALILKTIGALPTYRGKGVTAALIHLVADEAFRQGCRHVVSALVAHESHTPDHVSQGLSKFALSWVHDYGLLSCSL